MSEMSGEGRAQDKKEKRRNGPEHPTARLALAAKRGDWAAFEQALTDGGDAKTPTALISAALRGDLAMASRLLQEGADSTARDSHGVTAIQCAYQKRNIDMMEALLFKTDDKLGAIEGVSNPASSGARPRGVKNLFEMACASGDEPALALFLKAAGKKPSAEEFALVAGSRASEGARWVWEAMSAGERERAARFKDPRPTILQLAAKGNNLWALRLAKERLGQDMETEFDPGMSISTALGLRAVALATRAGSVEALEALLSWGAGADRGRVSPVPALHFCHEAPTDEQGASVARLLLAHGAPISSELLPLVSAARGERIHTAMALIEGGADVNAYARNGSASLHAAIAAGHRELAFALIERGADPEARSGATAMERMATAKGFKPADSLRAKAAMERREIAGGLSEQAPRRAGPSL